MKIIELQQMGIRLKCMNPMAMMSLITTFKDSYPIPLNIDYLCILY